jgi:TonB family protein
MRGHCTLAGALVAGCSILGETLGAQERSCRLSVRVTSAAGEPLAAVAVSIGPMALRTDSTGHATFTALPPGEAYVRARRPGFAPVLRGGPAHCAGGAHHAALQLVMAPMAQELAPVVVRADDRPRYAGPMAGFWERRGKGEGYFFTAAEIDRRNVQKMADLIRTIPGWSRNQTQRTSDAIVRGTAVRMGVATRDAVRGTGPATCYPTVVIDGMAATASELVMEGIDPRSLSGVEVYVDGSRTPAEFWGTAGQGRCGVVAVWSRSLDAMRHTPLEQQNVMADTVYDADDVDRGATLDATMSLPVVYPRTLRRKKARGTATVSVVVLPTGEPWLREAKVVAATHEDFGKALLDAVPTLRFTPAQRDGRSVAQRAVLSVAFEHPDAAPPQP